MRLEARFGTRCNHDHEIHELSFMVDPMRSAACSGMIRSLTNFSAYPTQILEDVMAWTTPAATDLRFGFEITMYIANR